jgi:hypothetical protein
MAGGGGGGDDDPAVGPRSLLWQDQAGGQSGMRGGTIDDTPSQGGAKERDSPLPQASEEVRSSQGQKAQVSQARWRTPAIPAIPEMEIRKIAVQGQPGQKFSKTPSQSISWTW